MIKLQDFARQQGVTDRAIQKHLKTYAEELDGLFQRKGPNGTWLTDEACEILRSKMKQQPVVLVDNQAQMDLAEAKARIEELQEQRVKAAEKLAALYEWKAEKAQLIAEAEQTRLLLDTTKQEKEILEGFISDAKAEIAALSDEKADAEVRAREAAEATQKAQDELTAAREREQQVKEYYKALAAWEALPKRKRWNTKKNREKNPKPVAPEWLQEG